MSLKRTTSSLLRASSRDSLSRLLFESEHSNGGGGDDRSLFFRFCQLVVLIIRSITPLSYAYVVYILIFPNSIPIQRNLTYQLFTLWMVIEVLFFPYYCYKFTKILNRNDHLQHLGTSKETRLKLMKNCLNSLKVAAKDESESHLYIRKVINLFIFG